MPRLRPLDVDCPNPECRRFAGEPCREYVLSLGRYRDMSKCHGWREEIARTVNRITELAEVLALETPVDRREVEMVANTGNPRDRAPAWRLIDLLDSMPFYPDVAA